MVENTIVKNIYLPVYEKLENELIDLSSYIHFTDDNLDVYSLKIADLIIRCSIEIESLIHSLFYREEGKNLEYIGEELQFLNKKYDLENKIVKVYSGNFNFSKKEVICFKPFDYKYKSEEDYYSTYNALKHNRGKNISKAKLYTLIRVYGALFILNMYYNLPSFSLGKSASIFRFDTKQYSKIFNFYVCEYEDKLMFENEDIPIQNQECLMKVIKEEGEYALDVDVTYKTGETDKFAIVNTSSVFQTKAKDYYDNPNDADIINRTTKFVIEMIVYSNLKNKNKNYQITKINNINRKKMNSRYFIKMNIESNDTV